MLRVVFDTNIVVSALLNEAGLPALLLDLATSNKIQLYYSQALMTEYKEVLAREKFNLPKEKIKNALDEIKRTSIEVFPKKTIALITRDPADNRILEISQAANADYIITGNKRHFPFATFNKAKIATPRQFIASEGAHFE